MNYDTSIKKQLISIGDQRITQRLPNSRLHE